MKGAKPTAMCCVSLSTGNIQAQKAALGLPEAGMWETGRLLNGSEVCVGGDEKALELGHGDS